MAFRVRWYFVTLEPSVDPAKGPQLPDDLNVYGRKEYIALSATEGIARVTCEDADHLTFAASPNARRITLGGVFGDLPNALKNRIRNYIAATDDLESLALVLRRLVRTKRPGAVLSDFLPQKYQQDGIERDEAAMAED